MILVCTLIGSHRSLQHLPNGFLDRPPLLLLREQMPRQALNRRCRYHHRPKFQGKEGLILRPLRQRRMPQELFGGQLIDTLGNVSNSAQCTRTRIVSYALKVLYQEKDFTIF